MTYESFFESLNPEKKEEMPKKSPDTDPAVQTIAQDPVLRFERILILKEKIESHREAMQYAENNKEGYREQKPVPSVEGELSTEDVISEEKKELEYLENIEKEYKKKQSIFSKLKKMRHHVLTLIG